MSSNFSPVRSKRGEFRVSIDINQLGDRAWSILALSQELGFEKPKFETCVRASGVVEVWATLLQQFHSYETDIDSVMNPWDDRIDSLRDAIGEEHHFILTVLCNFAEALEPVESFQTA